MYQLAWLEPLGSFTEQVGKAGCLYKIKTQSVSGMVSTSDCFWESENRLVPIQMDRIQLPNMSSVVYRLVQDIVGFPSSHLGTIQEDRPMSPNFFERE